MTVFVLDHSVTMRWCFDGDTHAYADAILSDIVHPVSMAFVPVLWRYEVSSVLARAEMTGQLTAKVAAEFPDLLGTLNIHVDDECSQRIFSDVYRAATMHRLTSYDAAYLELAQRRYLPLATLDAGLIAACHNAGVKLC